MTINKNIIGGMMLAAMISACSNTDTTDDLSDGSLQDEIRLKADVWHMVEGTRATTYDGGTQTSGSFTTTVYYGNSTDAYISPVTVNWVSTQWVWSDGTHRWPATGNLDFFAYMPATKPSYISAPAYSVSGTPQASFTCTDIPMTYSSASPTEGQGSNLQEFVWAITKGQNRNNQGETGVTMKFRRPFACIKFQLSASHPDITINSITFKSLKTGGTCTLNATNIADTYYYTTSVWSDLSGSSDLTMTLTSNAATFNNNPNTTQPIGGYSGSAHTSIPFLVIPQTWAGTIEVNATWSVWGVPTTQTVSTTIPTTWQPGYSYTYTFTINEAELIVNTTRFTEQW